MWNVDRPLLTRSLPFKHQMMSFLLTFKTSSLWWLPWNQTIYAVSFGAKFAEWKFLGSFSTFRVCSWTETTRAVLVLWKEKGLIPFVDAEDATVPLSSRLFFFSSATNYCCWLLRLLMTRFFFIYFRSFSRHSPGRLSFLFGCWCLYCDQATGNRSEFSL